MVKFRNDTSLLFDCHDHIRVIRSLHHYFVMLNDFPDINFAVERKAIEVHRVRSSLSLDPLPVEQR